MIGRPLNTMSNSVCPLIAKIALGPILILSLIVYTNTLCNLIALSRNYTSPAYNQTNAGRWDGASTDTNCLIVNIVHWSRPVDAPSPPLPGLSARSFIDSRLCYMYTHGRDGSSWYSTTEIIQHLKSMWSKSHFSLLISRFRLFSIAAKIIGFRSRFGDQPNTTVKAL